INSILWSAKKKSGRYAASFTSLYSDASRRVPISSQPSTPQPDCVGVGYREPTPTWAQANRGLTPHAASPSGFVVCQQAGIPAPEQTEWLPERNFCGTKDTSVRTNTMISSKFALDLFRW